MLRGAVILALAALLFAPAIVFAAPKGPEDIFLNLDYNGAEGVAIFTVLNPNNQPFDMNKLTIHFNETNGRVSSYKILVNTTCTREEPIRLTAERCLNTNGTNSCFNDTNIIGYETIHYECFEESTTLQIGTSKVKLVANLAFEQKPDGTFGYNIDWKPTIEFNGVNYTMNSWAWWNASYSAKRLITVVNWTCVSSMCTYPIFLDLDEAKTSGADLVFMNASENVRFNHWLETASWNSTTASGYVWVNATNGTTQMYVYYNASGAPDYSDGMTVCEFFDDFPGTSLNASKWTAAGRCGGGGSHDVSGGIIHMQSATAAWSDYIIETPTAWTGSSFGSRVNFGASSSSFIGWRREIPCDWEANGIYSIEWQTPNWYLYTPVDSAYVNISPDNWGRLLLNRYDATKNYAFTINQTGFQEKRTLNANLQNPSVVQFRVSAGGGGTVRHSYMDWVCIVPKWIDTPNGNMTVTLGDEVGGGTLTITDPVNTSVRTITAGNPFTFNFTYNYSGSLLTENVSNVNATVDGLACPFLTVPVGSTCTGTPADCSTYGASGNCTGHGCSWQAAGLAFQTLVDSNASQSAFRSEFDEGTFTNDDVMTACDATCLGQTNVSDETYYAAGGDASNDAYFGVNWTLSGTVNWAYVKMEGHQEDAGNICQFALWNWTAGKYKSVAGPSSCDDADVNLTYNISSANDKAAFINNGLVWSIFYTNSTAGNTLEIDYASVFYNTTLPNLCYGTSGACSGFNNTAANCTDAACSYTAPTTAPQMFHIGSGTWQGNCTVDAGCTGTGNVFVSANYTTQNLVVNSTNVGAINCQEAGADSCTPTAGQNWVIASTDNCVITTNYDLGGYNVTTSGASGCTKFQSNLTNVGFSLLDDCWILYSSMGARIT